MTGPIDSPELEAIDTDIEAALHAAAKSSETGIEDQATRLRRLVEQATGELQSAVPLSRLTTSPQPPVRTGVAKVIAVASGKGGVGKTNFAVNLAITLAHRGLRVILIDADLGTANADVLCGLNPAARLNHVITGLPVHDGARRAAADILVNAPGGFRLLPGAAGVSRMADLSAGEQRRMLEVIGELESDADVLIVDTAAGVGRSVTSIVQAADLGIVVTTPEPTAIADAYALVKCVIMSEGGHWQTEHAARLRLVVNQSGPAGEADAVHARLRAVCERFLGVPLAMLGEMAQDLRVAQSVRARRPFLLHAPDCQAARHMVVLSEKIIHQLGLKQDFAESKAPRGFRAALARVLLGRSS